jgi:endonuclease/exonuclease/phosphatase family metal-dependent hydrolase
MPTVRICSVNAEWMNDWFTPDSEPATFRPQFRRDGEVNDTAETARRLAAMLQAIDAPVIALQEAPSRLAELTLFVDTYLDGAYDVLLGESGGAQKLALLCRGLRAQRTVVDELTEPWIADVDGDAVLDSYSFTRTPLVVDVEGLQLIVAHLKSSFINNGRALWEDPARRQEFVVEALLNRRRISAEGMRIRRYLDRRLAEDAGAAIVVLGDLNDGPGLDYFEELYLTHNVTDIVVGSAYRPEWQFTHAQHDVPAPERYTAVFEDFVPTRQIRHLLLDHILLSPALAGAGAIRHAEYDAQVVDGGRRRQDRPSDHRPVTVDLRF